MFFTVGMTMEHKREMHLAMNRRAMRRARFVVNQSRLMT
jgi:hypothetical protein